MTTEQDTILRGLLEPRETPKASELATMLTEALNEASSLGIYQRMEDAHNARKAYWPGQSSDGRKWAECYKDLKEKRFPGPWEGASDVRIRSADEIIRECVLLQMAALRKGEMQIAPAHTEDPTKAALWRMVAAYFTNLMEAEIMREGEILSNLMNELGYAVMKVWWKRRYRLAPREIALQDIVSAAVDAALQDALESLPEGQELTEDMATAITQAAGVDFADMLTDPDRRSELIEIVLATAPEMPAEEAKRATRQLSKGNAAEYFAKVLAEDRPCVKAMVPWVHLFFPPNITSLEEAPWIAEPEWLSRVELQQRAEEEKWDPAFVTEVLEKGKGMAFDITGMPAWVLSGVDVSLALALDPASTTSASDIYQVITLWHQGMSKSGVAAWYRTVFHPKANAVGLHECSPYEHLSHNYITAAREWASPLLVASRGIGELARTDQQEVKIQVDTRTDNSALKTNPPMEVPVLQSGGQVDIRPGRQIPTRRVGGQGGITPLVWPSDVGSSVEIENAARQRLDGYYFRGMLVDPDVKRLAWTDLAARYLSVWKQIMHLVWRMIQQYTDEIQASTIAGQPVSLRAENRDLQGDPDIIFNFDAGNLSLDLLGKKLEWITKLLVPLDTSGDIDRSGLVRMAFQALDPNMARSLVRDAGQVTQAEVNEEMMAITMTMVGLEAPVKEAGINASLRIQVIQQAVAKSPRLQALLQQDPQVAAVLTRRAEMYQFQLTQQQNAQIGRQGGQPVLDEMAQKQSSPLGVPTTP